MITVIMPPKCVQKEKERESGREMDEWTGELAVSFTLNNNNN